MVIPFTGSSGEQSIRRSGNNFSVNWKTADRRKIGPKIEDFTENSESLPENTDQIYQLVGEATVDLLYAVFGNDAKEIIDFYEENYIEMLQQIMPFVEHVLQQIRSLGKIERKNAIKSYTNR